jgi:hypothetical protein
MKNDNPKQPNTYNLKPGMTLSVGPVMFLIKNINFNTVHLECQQLNQYGKKQKFDTSLSLIAKQICVGFYVIN